MFHEICILYMYTLYIKYVYKLTDRFRSESFLVCSELSFNQIEHVH